MDSIPSMHPSPPKMGIGRIVSFVLLLAVLVAVPIVTIILRNQTRTQIKADVSCKQPAVPDPKDCVGGTWKLYSDQYNCVKFRCVPGQ